jgi:Holliday junction resolvasome RuvABC endonuclease subunit
MITMGVDPGTHTISAAVLEGPWQRPKLLAVMVLRPFDREAGIRERVVSLSLQASMLGTWVQYCGASEVIVEGQHFHGREKDPDDIINVAAVAGACLLGAQLPSSIGAAQRLPRVMYAAAGTWSKMEKGMRAKRIVDIYMPEIGLTRHLIQEAVGRGNKLSAREYGDVIDAIGMAYWALKGCPREGV